MSDTIEYKGYTIRIVQDSDPESPREWCNLGEMVCFHPRYNLGDKHKLTPESLNAELATGDYVYRIIRAYEHGNISLTADPIRSLSYPYCDVWDSGTVGVIRVSKAKIREEYSCKRISKGLLQRVYSYLESEVETYNSYLNGDVWGYETADPEGNEIDSGFGYYGYDPENNGLLESAHDAIDYDINQKSIRAHESAVQLELAGFFE